MRSLTKYSAQFYCGLRFRLLLLMAVACCPLVLLTLHTASEDRRRVLANWPQRAQRMAEFASGQEDTLISQTRQLLLALADSASVRWLNPPTCKELVDQLFASCPRYANLGVIKTDGEIVATALPLSGNFVTHRSVSGQDSGLHQTSCVATSLRRLLLAPHDDPTRFKGLMQARAVRARENEEPLSSSVSQFAQQAEESNPFDTPHTMPNWMALPSGDFFQRILLARAFAIDDFSFCQQSDPGTVCFGCPIFGPLGQLQGVAFATLDRTRFNPCGSAMATPIPKGATWAEFDANGKTLLRYPQSQPWTPELFEDDSVLKTSLAEKRNLVESLDSRGVPTVYAFVSKHSRLMPDARIAVLAIPRHLLFAQADRQIFRNLSWLAIAAGLALALGWLGSNLLIVRPINALVSSTLRLAGGDLTARSGLNHRHDELGQLTRAYDQMGEILEDRDREHKRARRKLQALSHKLVEAQESERRHIARELHDEIGQSLVLAEMNLQAALEAADKSALSRRLEQSVQAVQRVLGQVHDLSLNLRPSMLDDLGLEPALRWYTHRQATLAGLQLQVQADPMAARLDALIETECFRIAQEALTNIVRHANARVVTIELKQKDGQLHLFVRDDGVGFDVAPARERAVRGASLGLLSMQERASLAGGGFEVHSAPGQGSQVHAWFPLKWHPACC